MGEGELERIRAALSGSREAGRWLTEELAAIPRMLRQINARRGVRVSSHDLEDLGQDVLVKIWEKLATFRGPATFANWVYRFCLYEFLNRVRALEKSNRQAPLGLEELEAVREADAGRAQELVMGLVAQLEEDEVDILQLKHFEGLTFQGIAERMQCPVNTVKSRYYRGLARLRERVTRKMEAEPS